MGQAAEGVPSAKSSFWVLLEGLSKPTPKRVVRGKGGWAFDGDFVADLAGDFLVMLGSGSWGGWRGGAGNGGFGDVLGAMRGLGW